MVWVRSTIKDAIVVKANNLDTTSSSCPGIGNVEVENDALITFTEPRRNRNGLDGQREVKLEMKERSTGWLPESTVDSTWTLLFCKYVAF